MHTIPPFASRSREAGTLASRIFRRDENEEVISFLVGGEVRALLAERPEILHLLQQFQPALPGIFAALLVIRIRVGRIFTGAHKAVTGAFIGDWFKLLAGLFHGFRSLGQHQPNNVSGKKFEPVYEGAGQALCAPVKIQLNPDNEKQRCLEALA